MHRWCGSKRRILDKLFAELPAAQPDGSRWRRYVAPFYGSGADSHVAIDRRLADEFLLGDTNPDLVAAHLAARTDPAALCSELAELAAEARDRPEAVYLAVRDGRRRCSRAARFMFICGSGFNGLWRTRRDGGCNVPFGRPFYFDPREVHAVGELLRRPGVHLMRAPWSALVSRAGAGDLVYADPPYLANFSGYAAGGFDFAAHARLAAGLRAACARGAVVYVSNSDTPETRALYPGRRVSIEAHRSVSCKGGDRGATGELLIELAA